MLELLMQEWVELAEESEPKAELTSASKEGTTGNFAPRNDKRHESVIRICVVCDDDYQGDPLGIYCSLSCKQARYRDKQNGNLESVKPRGPSRFEMAQREIFHQSGLSPIQIVHAREVALKADGLIAEAILSGVVDEEILELLEQRIKGNDFMSLDWHAARLGLKRDYEIIIESQDLPIGQVIKAWREARGFGQRALARVSGVGHSTIQVLEERPVNPYRSTLDRLVVALDIEVDDVLNRLVPRRVQRSPVLEDSEAVDSAE